MDTYVKTASSIYCYPINFRIAGDLFLTKQTPIYFDNGLFFNVHSFLEEPEDVKINKKTGIFLTSLLSSKNIFVNSQNPKDSVSLKFIETPVCDQNFSIISLSSNYQNTRKYLVNTQRTFYNNTDTLKFIFNSDSVSVEGPDGSYLTYSGGTGGDTLYFSPRLFPIPDTQKFEYLLSNDSIVLFTLNSYYSRGLSEDTTTKIFCVSNVNVNPNETFPKGITFNFVSYKTEPISYETVTDSYMARYVSSPLLNQKELIPTLESTTEAYKQNYLAMFPVENPKIENDVVEYNLQIHGLKNYQTPEYNYSRGIKYNPESNSIRRTYKKIFSGTNQTEGTDKIYLEYTANTFEKIFLEDTFTTFHYPAMAPRSLIQYAGLTEDGAYPAEVPYIADRIYSKQIDYTEIIGGVQPPTIQRQTGTWLCSWLYDAPSGPTWLDRYYNSAYYTSDQALSATTFIYHRYLNEDFEYDVWDEPSKMVLEPGATYSYYRAGLQTSKNFLQFLSQDFNRPLGAKLIDIDTFNQSQLIDKSNYKNNGLLFNNKPENLKGDYIVLDGSNHAIFPAKNVLLEQNNLTLSIWLNVDDWSNITGDQIIGNYYDSGFGLINEASLTAPLLTLINTTSGVFYNLNYKFSQVDTLNLPYLSGQQNYIVQRMPDFSYWIVDVYNRVFRKYSIEGVVKQEFTIPSISATYINQLEVDSSQNMYVYDNSLKKVLVFNSLGQSMSSTQIAMGYNRIEIDLNDVMVPAYGNCSVIDNDNNLWEMVGANLYKNRQIHANIGPAQQITCDSQNNLWIAHAKDKLTKYNLNTSKFEFTKSIGRNILIDDSCFTFNEQFRFLDLMRVPKTGTECTPTTEKNEDLLVLVDDIDKEALLINMDGLLVAKINLNGLISTDLATVDENIKFKALGDFTGYQYLRKYSITDKNISWCFKIADVNGQNPQLLKLKYDVNNLPQGWHNFVFNFNSKEGLAKYYIDTFLVASVDFQPNRYQIYYDYKSSILLGAANIKNATLNDIIKIDDAYKFIGSVGSILMYSKSFSKGEIEQIYYSSPFAISKGSLKWNLNTGERNYIEQIEHWFQMQLPSNKSKYFNINVHNFTDDENVKAVIEDAIRNNIKKIAPAHTELYKINWI